MDGYTPLVLDDEPVMTPAIADAEAAWVAVSVGDSVMFVWFGGEE
ncbi:hypothetical protein [Niveispirillum cyanobacteriorum]|jgi:hypothetical protein|nr:hypothetical protein [Niveispirillum cyanobacteriorum]GGE80201.1 hypothetical protein GCM10011317_41750 [Niveispirillum cyanobacteriorum]